LRFSVDITAPVKPFTKNDLNRIITEERRDTEFDIANKIAEYSHPSVTVITDVEAEW
jgi:hypothetical protein